MKRKKIPQLHILIADYNNTMLILYSYLIFPIYAYITIFDVLNYHIYIYVIRRNYI